MGDPWGVPTETGDERLGEPWKTKVLLLSDRREETQSTIEEGTWEARSLPLRVEALTLSKPALISRKRVETFNPGLWRVFISCMGVRQVAEELSPGRDPHLLGWRRLLDLAKAASLTCITRTRIFEMVLVRTRIRKDVGVFLGATSCLAVQMLLGEVLARKSAQ